jgi:membrane protein YdbS with pleckstrin-like domain
MLDALRPLILRVFRVPDAPATPRGEHVRVFRASHNYYRYNLLRWALKQAGALIGVFFGLAFIRALPETVPGAAMGWIRFGEAVAITGFVLQLPFTYAMLRLDFQMRWYVVGERSLRIREGLATVREQTMTFANIQNMSIRQGPLQRLLGIADLEVRTAGGGSGEGSGGKPGHGSGQMHVGTFRGVDDAAQIRDAIRERVRHFRDAGLGDPDDAAAPPPPASAQPAAESPALLAAREVLAAARALRAEASVAGSIRSV